MAQESSTEPSKSNVEIYPEVRELSNRVKQQFIVAFELSSTNSKVIVELTNKLPNHLQEAPQSFLAALKSISDAVCLPNRIAVALTWQNEHSQALLHELHSINSKGYLPNESEENAHNRIKEQARVAADEKMRTITESTKRFNNLFRKANEALLFDPFLKTTEHAALELRYQSIVGIWSAVEVLLKDQLIEIINWKPELSKKLITDEVARRRFELPKLTLEGLEEHNFNLQSCMGDLLIRQRDASDLYTLKAAVGAIWGKNDLFNALESREIRLLNLQRHLIVHKRGKLDEKYLYESGEPGKVGEKMAIPPSSIVKAYRAAAEVGKLACQSFLDICTPS